MPWERPLADRGPPPPPPPTAVAGPGRCQRGFPVWTGSGGWGGRGPAARLQAPTTAASHRPCPTPLFPFAWLPPAPPAGGTPLLRSPFPAPTSARDPRHCPHGAPNSPRTHTAKHPRLRGVSGAGGRAAVRFPGNGPRAAAWHLPSGALGPPGRDGLLYFQRKQTQRFETGKAESGLGDSPACASGPFTSHPPRAWVSGKYPPLEGPVAFTPEAKTPRQDAVESKYLTVNSEKVKMPTVLSSLVLETALLSGG